MEDDMKKIKLLWKLVCFVLIFLIAYEGISYLTYPSNTITECWEGFYKQEKNSINTLIVGSSHAYASFSPEIVSEYTDGKAFILASNSQAVTQTYYNVKEALKYQKPKRIILEAFSINNNDNWKKDGDKDWKKESNIDGMRDGFTKLEAVIHQYDVQNWAYAFVKLGRCHSNWKDSGLIRQNWERSRQSMEEYNGFQPSTSSMSPETIEKYGERKYNKKYVFRISDSNREYFHKLAALCRENDIELLVVMAPMYDKLIQSFDYSKQQQAIQSLVEEENLVYIDCNLAYEEIGLEAIDFEDAYNDYHHLNLQGAEKVTTYVMERWMHEKE